MTNSEQLLERYNQESKALEDLYSEQIEIKVKIRYAEKRLKITADEMAELTKDKPAAEELKEISKNLK